MNKRIITFVCKTKFDSILIMNSNSLINFFFFFIHFFIHDNCYVSFIHYDHEPHNTPTVFLL